MVVPCFNEAPRLNTDAFLDYLSTVQDVDFLFVDDGSTDATAHVLNELCSRAPERVSALFLPSNRGKGEAVRAGINKAMNHGYKYCGFWDADLATPLSAITRFMTVLDQNPNVSVVIGSRIRLLGRRIERRPLRHYAGRVFATIASLCVGFAVYDSQCGAKLFRNSSYLREAFSWPFWSRWLFDLEILLRLEKAWGERIHTDCLVREEPLEEWRDVSGSKVTIAYAVLVPLALLAIFLRERAVQRPRVTEISRV
jgi:glycosyltransferase involved in cell wall biosynthesis